MTGRQWAALLSLSLSCSANTGSATPPPSNPRTAAESPPAQAPITGPASQIATDAQLTLRNVLANCLRCDATVLAKGDGSKALQLTFFAKQSTGYCGCKSALVKYVVSHGKPGNPPAPAEHEFHDKFNSMTAAKQEINLMVPLPPSPGNAYGVEIRCMN